MENDQSSPEELIAYARTVVAGLNQSSEDIGLAASALEVTIEELERALKGAQTAKPKSSPPPPPPPTPNIGLPETRGGKSE